MSRDGKTIIEEMRLKGDRIQNKEETARRALSFLIDELSEKK